MKFVTLFFLFASLAHAQPEIITAPVDHLYIPEGFDNNDSVEVVVTGTFPNACYSRNIVEVTYNDALIDIHVTAIVPEKTRKCTDMIVPFKEVVALGTLQGGEYSIRVNYRSPVELSDTMKIQEATSNSVDEHIYADVDRVEKVAGNDYVLHGWRYSNCIEFGKVEVISNKKDTFSVLPVMKQVSDFCPMKMMPISFPVKLNASELKMNKPLVHVRTMDGKSFNSILNLAE